MFKQFNFPEDLIDRYMEGECHILTFALSRMVPSKTYVLREIGIHDTSNGPITYSLVVHSLVYLLDRNIFVDINGIFYSQQAVIDFWIDNYTENDYRFGQFILTEGEDITQLEDFKHNLKAEDISDAKIYAKIILEQTPHDDVFVDEYNCDSGEK